MRKSSQHYKNPSSHPSIEIGPSNQLSSVSPALYLLSTDCTARVKQWIPISDTLSDPNIAHINVDIVPDIYVVNRTIYELLKENSKANSKLLKLLKVSKS